MRLFIAIQLNDSIKASLDEIQRRLIRQGVYGNFTPPENLHLTLAFIGEYPDADDVMQALEAVSFQPFSLGLNGFGSFGDLWWVGLSDSVELEALVRRIRHALSDSGIPFDRKRFSPHITLIRKASYRGRGKFPEITIPPESMTVERFSLMRSDRGKHGMIYTELGTVQQA